MSTNELTAEERTERRATWEAMEMAVCPGVGKVNVANVSYGETEAKYHTYTVTVEDGSTTDCTCPANKYQTGACKHRVAVESRQPVMLAASYDVVTDGGEDECDCVDGWIDDANGRRRCFRCVDFEELEAGQ